MNLTSPLRPLLDVPRILRHGKGTREEIVAFQEKRLREMVHHAYERVPYYRRLFDESRIKPEDILTLADLHLIPITTKATLRALARDEIVARGVNPNRLIRHESSGSTGVLVTVYRQRAEAISLAAMHRRARSEARIGRGLHVAIVNWRRRATGTQAARRQRGSLLHRFWGIESTTRIDCALPVEVIAKQLEEARPDVIMGYPGVLSFVAAHLGDGQTAIRPRHVITVSEVVTPGMRARMELVFGAPVRDLYGCWELATIAHECGGGGTYHVCDDNLILEVLRDGRQVGANESGEVVGTSLNCAAMPLIRYELGDVVTRGPDRCDCGSPFSTLKAIQGRVVDYFPLPDGRVLHPYQIDTIIRKDAARRMRQYQLVQERTDRIVARVSLTSEQYRDDVLAEMRRVETLLASRVELVVEFVDDIPPGPRGKFGVYRSLVSSEYT